MRSPVPSSTETIAVSATSAPFVRQLGIGELALFVSTTACYLAQANGSAPTAAAGAGVGSVFIPANTPTLLNGTNGAYVSVVQASAGGFACLSRAQGW